MSNHDDATLYFDVLGEDPIHADNTADMVRQLLRGGRLASAEGYGIASTSGLLPYNDAVRVSMTMPDLDTAYEVGTSIFGWLSANGWATPGVGVLVTAFAADNDGQVRMIHGKREDADIARASAHYEDVLRERLLKARA